MNRQSIPKILSQAAVISVVALAILQPAALAETLRPPSVPLVACDPYFSIWSPADKLTDANTVHWTGKPHRLTSLVRIDGKAFRLMGAEPADVPPLPQVNLEVLPTRTIYTFEGEGVRLTLTFMTAALPEDLMIYSRPVTYLTWEAQSTSSKKHAVEVYFDASAQLAVNVPTQEVGWSRERVGGLPALKVGSLEQPVLAKRGDDLRIDWGYLYLAEPKAPEFHLHVSSPPGAFRSGFIESGVSRNILVPGPMAGPASEFVLSAEADLGKVGSKPVSRWLILAYDDLYSIQYFKKNLRPYWRRNGAEAADLLNAAAHDYESLVKRCAAFDARLMADLRKAGGEKYAQICALAYRQCVAANKLVADANGQPLLFPKENFSNGCIGTVDVIYPMAPQFLLFNPSLAKAMLVPILDYAASPRWRWPFAPHDLGTYPLANGQVYGGGERTEKDQMPVEESGNMLLLIAALAQVEGNADFAAKYWPVLEKWADYLRDKGFDPENQLCTDDFAGHLAHNVNLSAKAICGLGAFAKLSAMRGDTTKAREYQKLAKEFAARWVKEADDGDHFRLAFDKPSTWSQKYNLVWDRILGLDLFPAEALRKEMDYYKKKQNQYGLPLDNRKAYTKLDWTLWTATLTGSPEDMDALASRVLLFLNSTPDRVPMTDWYWTQNAKHTGFQARSVVGGVFLKLLYDQSLWRKWAGRDQTKAMNWAPLPEPPKVTVVVPAADKEPATWRYTTEKPGEQWFAPDFDASSWKEGKSGFGTAGTPGAIIGTTWNTGDIWLRREIEAPAGKWQDLQFWMHHDEDAEVYLNGVLASKTSGYISNYDLAPIMANAKAALKPGKCVIAVHCHQTTGGQYIDVGLVDVEAK
jgi:hypothetical protein